MKKIIKFKKRRFRLFISAVMLLFLTSGAGFAKKVNEEKPLVTAVADVDRNSVTIGDEIRYSIEARTKNNIEVEFPNFGENLAGFAIKDFGSSEKSFWGNKKVVQWYLLDSYVTGEYNIPKAILKYKDTKEEVWEELETNEVEVEVKSVLEDEAIDIRDIKGPVSFPDKVNLFILAGIIAFIAAAGAGAVLFMKIKKEEKSVFLKAPHEIAYEALEELKGKEYIKLGKIKEYYIELSLIVRDYLENRFMLKAPEMTTEEFLTAAKGSNQLSYEQKNLVEKFLSHCDLVKFAKYGPSEEEMNNSFDSAKKLVDQTKEEISVESLTK